MPMRTIRNPANAISAPVTKHPAFSRQLDRATTDIDQYVRQLLCHCVPMPLEGSAAQFYRDEAKRIRALADASSLADVKKQLLTIADEFDRLAEQYENGLRR